MIYAKKPDGKEYVVQWIPHGLWWSSLVAPIINGVKIKTGFDKENQPVIQKISNYLFRKL